MSSLLHQLLHDLRQRCGHLVEELRKLNHLKDEARHYCDQTQRRVEQTGRIIEQFLADPGLNHPLLVRNYYHDYKRLSETVFSLEAGPVIALKHFQDDDRDITRIVARICQEIGYPYSPPLCVAISSQYYWAIPAADLVFVPCDEAATVVLWEVVEEIPLSYSAEVLRPFLAIPKERIDRDIADIPAGAEAEPPTVPLARHSNCPRRFRNLIRLPQKRPTPGPTS